MMPPSPRSGGSGGWSSGTQVGLVIGIVVTLVICALPVTGFFLYWFAGPDIDDAKAVAGQYFDRVEAGDDAGAYQLLCADAQKAMTQDAFVAKLKDGFRPVDHAVLGGAFADEPGYEARIDVRLVGANGATREVDLSLEGRNGDPWRVCGDTFI
ncbi:hypothetical protein FBZ33_6452 [Micromonospora sp. A202]|nr:hypothetical protein FBZ33_6452 [Micromonospora sp. A202]